jgi:hypothetical protein
VSTAVPQRQQPPSTTCSLAARSDRSRTSSRSSAAVREPRWNMRVNSH